MKNLILTAFVLNTTAAIACSVSAVLNIMTGNAIMAAVMSGLIFLNTFLAIENFNKLRNLK